MRSPRLFAAVPRCALLAMIAMPSLSDCEGSMSQLRRVRPRLFLASAVVPAWMALAIASPAYADQSGQTYEQLPETSLDADTPAVEEPAAHVNVVDGQAWLERDGESRPLDENELVVDGDRISTERGRVELLFRDGSALALDENTAVEWLGPAFLRLERGHIGFTVDRRVSPNTYRVDAAEATIWVRSAGEYRLRSPVFAGDTAVLLVVRGLAEVQTSRQRTLVRAGYEAAYAAGSTVTIDAVPVTRWAAFDRWIDTQERERVSLSAAPYLPAELRSYSRVLDTHGSWQYDSSNGYVWYPDVSPDWYPYSVGRWASVGSFGWTWVGVGRWAWPTHHYGRWGYAGARWYWIPGRQWAPAWVAWATSPTYVAWAPIGFTPSIGVGVSVGTARRGWSAIPARAFAAGPVLVQRDRLPLSRLPDRLVVSRPPARPLPPPRTSVRAVEPGLPFANQPNGAQPRPGVLGNARAPLDRGPLADPGRRAATDVDRPAPPVSRPTPAGNILSRRPTRPRDVPAQRPSEPATSRRTRPDTRGPQALDDARPSPAVTPAPPTRFRRVAPEATTPSGPDPVMAPRARSAGGVERPAPVDRSGPTTGMTGRAPGASRPPTVERPAPPTPGGPPGSSRAVPRAEPRGGGRRDR